MWLIMAAQQTAESGSSLVPVYYVISIFAVIVAGLWSLKKYSDRQKQNWIDKGKQEQDLADKLEANVEATTKLNASLDKLTERMDKYAQNVDVRMNGHDRRIEKLEDYAQYGTAPYRRNQGAP